MNRFGRTFGPVALLYVAVALTTLALDRSSAATREVTGERFFLFVAGCGISAMILIESLKRLVPVRGWYTRRAVANWLRFRAAGLPQGGAEYGGAGATVDLAMGQIIEALSSPRPGTRRLTGDDEAEFDQEHRDLGENLSTAETRKHATFEEAAQRDLGARWQRLLLSGAAGTDVFNLPVEQFVGQLSAATDYALDEPHRHIALVRVLTCRLPYSTQMQLLHRMMLAKLQHSPADMAYTDPGASAARGTLERELVFALDQLQISLATGWRKSVRMSAATLAGVIGFFAIISGAFDRYESGIYVAGAFLLGGWVSWFARDLTAVVERLRR